MSRDRRRVQSALYVTFLVSLGMALLLGLPAIWGVDPGKTGWRLISSCALIAMSSALALSATRIVLGQLPEDDKS